MKQFAGLSLSETSFMKPTKVGTPLKRYISRALILLVFYQTPQVLLATATSDAVWLFTTPRVEFDNEVFSLVAFQLESILITP